MAPSPWGILRRRNPRKSRREKLGQHFRLRGRLYRQLAPRVGLVVLFVAAAVFLFPPTKRSGETLFRPGQISDRNVIAPFDFEVPRSDEDLRIERASAALDVRPVYVHERELEQSLARDLDAALDSLAAIVANESIAPGRAIEMAEKLFPYLSHSLVRELAEPASLQAVRRAARDFQKSLFARGVVDDAGPLRRRPYTEISVVDGGRESKMPARDLIDQGSVERVIKEEGYARFGKDRARAQVFYEIVRNYLVPNLTYDAAETERRRADAMAAVPKTVKVAKDERIVGKHDKVTPEQARVLAALEQAHSSREAGRVAGSITALYAAEVLRLLLFALLFGGYIYFFQRHIYVDWLKLAAVVTVFFIYLVFAALVVRFSLSYYLFPVAFVSLMIGALFDHRMGLGSAVFASVLVPLVTDISPHAGFVSLVAGTVAVIALANIRARSRFYSVFTLVAAAYVVGVSSAELGHVEKLSLLYGHVLWAVANALFCSVAAMFLMPMFEGLFNLVTRFTLLELTDLNKPILKRLHMEAPGTYHHSMLLGSIVDAVAAEVGADPLKARVMAYYHDIGKINKPEYYAENQDAGFNKHEKIAPQMSALILQSHVKEGVELARQEKLPDLIVEGIEQHHGTTVMAYFYQKALETDSHSSVNKDDFRYPGPRPKSKEAAILMLADTVEPACRSLREPTPTSIRNTVMRLSAARAQEGELDESGLTMNDFARIRDGLINMLINLYHKQKRVPYPGQEKEGEGRGEAFVKPVGSG